MEAPHRGFPSLSARISVTDPDTPQRVVLADMYARVASLRAEYSAENLERATFGGA
jgi:hypothetical protein